MILYSEWYLFPKSAVFSRVCYLANYFIIHARLIIFNITKGILTWKDKVMPFSIRDWRDNFLKLINPKPLKCPCAINNKSSVTEKQQTEFKWYTTCFWFGSIHIIPTKLLVNRISDVTIRSTHKLQMPIKLFRLFVAQPAN